MVNYQFYFVQIIEIISERISVNYIFLKKNISFPYDRYCIVIVFFSSYNKGVFVCLQLAFGGDAETSWHHQNGAGAGDWRHVQNHTNTIRVNTYVFIILCNAEQLTPALVV